MATAIINPKSANAPRAQRRLKRLQKVAPFEIRRWETSRDKAHNRELAELALTQSDLVIVLGGDGTFNDPILTTLVNEKLPPEVREKPVWALGGGNAEDGHKAKHSRLHRSRPEWVLEDGRIVPTYPIRCDVIHDGEHRVYPAAFYASLGATALASSELYLNSPEHRSKGKIRRALTEPPLVAGALGAAEVNEVMAAEGPEHFYENVFANSHIMAKYLRLPTSLTRRELAHFTVREKQLRQIVPGIVRLVTSTIQTPYMRRNDTYEFQATQDIWAEFDGEATKFKAGSQFRIGMYEQPIYVVTTNPDL